MSLSFKLCFINHFHYCVTTASQSLYCIKKGVWKAETKFCPYTQHPTHTYTHCTCTHPVHTLYIFPTHMHPHCISHLCITHTHASWSCSLKTLTHTETAMREQKSKQRTSLTSAKVKNGKTMIQILCIWTDSPSLCQTWMAENSLLK